MPSVKKNHMCLPKDRILEIKRKNVLKKIKKLPRCKRHILHGRNFLPWRQKEENYCRTSTVWMDKYEILRIDDIVDLNISEKIFFKFWNNHIQKFSGIGITQMPCVVHSFIEKFGFQIWRENIYRTFIAHLFSLEKMSLIGSHCILKAIMQLQNLLFNKDSNLSKKSWKKMYATAKKIVYS